MKFIIAAALVLGAFATSSLHAPQRSAAAARASNAAPALAVSTPATTVVTPPAPVALQASSGDEVNLGWTWVCDEPYGQFPTLKACRAACSVQCGVNY